MIVKERIFTVLIILAAACVLNALAPLGQSLSSHISEPAVQNEPSIVFSSLLANVTVDARSGRIKIGNSLQSAYMPEEASGRIALSTSSGSEISQWKWSLDSFPMPRPYRLLKLDEPTSADGAEVTYSDLRLREPGSYVIDFYLHGRKFHSFNFSLRVAEPPDPFVGEVLYLTDGTWNDWGYLYYAGAKPTQPLIWKVFMRDEEHGSPQHSLSARIVHDASGDVVCRSDEGRSFRLSHDWVRQDIVLYNPDGEISRRNFCRARSLLRSNGDHTLIMELDGREYGRWNFRVEMGSLVRDPRAARSSADPLRFIEGGEDAFWYKKKP